MLGVGGTFGGGGDSEQSPEGVEGIIPPVEAEDEFVEISLQVLMAHPVMGPDQPGLEVGKNEVDDGKKGFGGRLPPDVFKICVEDELRVAEPAWRWWLERGSRDDISAATGEIDFPALVIAGDDDRVLGPDTAPAIARSLPRAKLKIVPDAGHLSPLERPAVIAALVREFVVGLGA